MFTRDSAPSQEPPEDLDPGERAVAPPSRVIVWGSGRTLAGGLLTLTDRHLRFTPAWTGLNTVLTSPATTASVPPLKIPREQVRGVHWERTAVFLKGLRVELPGGHDLMMLAGREVMEQVASALGVAA